MPGEFEQQCYKLDIHHYRITLKSSIKELAQEVTEQKKCFLERQSLLG